MNAKQRLILCLIVLAGALTAQNTSSSVSGIAVDPSGAPVPNAECRLTNQATGITATVQSGTDGTFTFPTVYAGVFTVSIRAAGFKSTELKDIPVTASEKRAVGRIVLQIGETRESVTVTADANPVQLLSAERSGVITGNQLNSIALKGRDFFALLATIPGVVDTNDSRESTGTSTNGGTFVNGARDNQKNFVVDGVTDMDTGANASLAYQPNMDSISEVKVLTGIQQAEFGRNSGATVTVVTKSGGRELHGSAYNYYRHEGLNANDFFNNRTGTAKAPYRYRISGYSIGGPIYVPGHFNKERQKLFFFFSQEYTGIRPNYSPRFVTTPTAAERNGDYSQSKDVSGVLIAVKDPTTGKAFPGNIVPANRISEMGRAILNFFPLPNYTDPDPRNLYRYNYRSVYTAKTSRRNDILRLDANLDPTWTLYYRRGHDKHIEYIPWGNWKNGTVNYLLSPVILEAPGTGHLAHATKTLSSTLVNEIRFAFNPAKREFDYEDPSLLARSRMGNPPQWYPDSSPRNYIPDVAFGGQPANTVQAVLYSAVPYHYQNWNYTFTDNLNKVWRGHNFKVGIYLERLSFNFPATLRSRGYFNFTRNTANSLDTNNSFSNALLGNFNTYTEATAAYTGRIVARNVEFYTQDNWRVTRRLTLDYGVRFYHMEPSKELTGRTASFVPELYNPAAVPTKYIPGLNAAGERVAVDPVTGQTASVALIGLFVPGTGNVANGSAIAGTKGLPAALISRPAFSYGPRFGFAYDLFGRGKSAVRAGFGLFHDPGQTNPLMNTLGNAPVSYSPAAYNGNLSTLAQASGYLGPSTTSALFGKAPLPTTMNFSFGIQQIVKQTLLDVAYVGSLSRHLHVSRNINPIPMFARFDRYNVDPTTGRALADTFLAPYGGVSTVTLHQWSGTSNYNALQVSASRRYAHGWQLGLAYTFSKALGAGSADAESMSPYFSARARNYGPLSFNRTHSLVLNYICDLPKLGTRMAFKPAHWILDNWQLSGITSFVTGAPFTPGFSTSDGADISGSSESARIDVIGNPRLSRGDKTFYRNFDTSAFARPAPRTFGTGGLNYLTGPGINNWDLALAKRVPLFSEKRYLQFRAEAFNAWNHTQFSSYYTTATFDAKGKQIDPNFGAVSASRRPRVVQFSARVTF